MQAWGPEIESMLLVNTIFVLTSLRNPIDENTQEIPWTREISTTSTKQREPAVIFLPISTSYKHDKGIQRQYSQNTRFPGFEHFAPQSFSEKKN